MTKRESLCRTAREDLRAHLSRFWPQRNVEFFQWTFGTIKDKFPELRVARVQPESGLNEYVYVSSGLAAQAPASKGNANYEYAIVAPKESPQQVETLSVLASYLLEERTHEHEVGRVFNLGQPWIYGSSMTYLLASFPYPFGPEFEHCMLAGVECRIRWLVPIYEQERAYLSERGLEALEQKFDNAQMRYWDPHRESVC